MKILQIPLLRDNYGYLLVCEKTQQAAIIDPSEAEPVLGRIETEQVTLRAILNTHHHADHTGGNLALLAVEAGIDLHDKRRNERHADVDHAGSEARVRVRRELNVLDGGETLGPQQRFGHVLRGDTDAWDLREADGRSFRRRFLRPYFPTADQAGGRGRGEGCE